MFREREQLSNHEHHHHENECCAREAAPTEMTLNASAAGNLQTTLQVAGVDCAEEVSMIQRALKPLGGVREVRVNIMSGKAIIAHDETITPEVLIKVIGDAGLKAIREGEKAGDEAQQRQKQRLLSVSISGAFTLLGLLVHWTHFAPESVAIALFPRGHHLRRLVHCTEGGRGSATPRPGHEPAHDHCRAWRRGYW